MKKLANRQLEGAIIVALAIADKTSNTLVAALLAQALDAAQVD